MVPDGSQCSVSLRRLFPQATFVGCGDISVASVCTDSRALKPGQLFVAIRGPKTDGHRFIVEVAASGACALLLEKPQQDCRLPQCVVPDSREAFSKLCHALAGNPAARLTTVGITGTNGKSTTAYLTKSVIEAAGYNVGLIGTIEHFDGNTSIPAAMTTPGPELLAKLMRRMVDAGCSHAVMEVSSHALDQHRVAGISFDSAVFTNLTQDHLDYHGDFARYRAAKAKLFRELAPGACAVLNSDDATSKEYARSTTAQKLGYAVRGVSDLTAVGIQSSLQGNRFWIETRSGRCEITSPLVGTHNVYNCLAAAAVGRRMGLSWDVIRKGIEAVRGVPGRLEAVHHAGAHDFHVFVDYAHTPDAIASVLKGLRAIAGGRILCMFGAGGDRDRTKRPLMAQAAEAIADMIVVTSDNPRSENPQRIIGEIVAGFKRTHALAIEPDRRKAIQTILAMAQPGDCVLLAGKGHESYQIIGDERLPFDDRQVAAECLARQSESIGIACGAGTEKRHSTPPRGRLACGA
jgi:UDP-N-acetylmuramoyl-L-alanyl-D-glutamate--2,6-diaminopimelate ligase